MTHHEATKMLEDHEENQDMFLLRVLRGLRVFVVKPLVTRTSYKSLQREPPGRAPCPGRRTLHPCESAPACRPPTGSRMPRAETCSTGNSAPARRSRRSRSGTTRRASCRCSAASAYRPGADTRRRL